MDETTSTLRTAWLGCSAIAGLTFFFSSRPRLFVRIFVPPDELRGAVRGIVRDPQFRVGMRWMAALQFAAASLFGLAWLWRRIA